MVRQLVPESLQFRFLPPPTESSVISMKLITECHFHEWMDTKVQKHGTKWARQKGHPNYMLALLLMSFLKPCY